MSCKSDYPIPKPNIPNGLPSCLSYYIIFILCMSSNPITVLIPAIHVQCTSTCVCMCNHATASVSAQCLSWIGQHLMCSITRSNYLIIDGHIYPHRQALQRSFSLCYSVSDFISLDCVSCEWLINTLGLVTID